MQFTQALRCLTRSSFLQREQSHRVSEVRARTISRVPQKSAATADNTINPFPAAPSSWRMPASSEYTRNTNPPATTVRPVSSNILHHRPPTRSLILLVMLKNLPLSILEGDIVKQPLCQIRK